LVSLNSRLESNNEEEEEETPGMGLVPARCRAKKEELERGFTSKSSGLLPQSQGQDLALTVLLVLHSLGSGWWVRVWMAWLLSLASGTYLCLSLLGTIW